jgi:hypothetical protein
MEVVGIEIPTRVSKQFNKTLRLLAVVREHEALETSDFLTLQRIAKDTVINRRQKIMDVFSQPDIDFMGQLSTSDIASRARQMYYRTANNECQIMHVLGILNYDSNNALYRPSEDFLDSIRAAYNLPEGTTLLPVHSEKKPENGLFSARTPPKMVTPDSPEGQLIAFATRLLNVQIDKTMERSLFFNTMYEARYSQDVVEAVLRDKPQFVFNEGAVELRESENGTEGVI